MKDEQLLTLACQYLGVDKAQVMTWRVYEDHIALVVRPGPKHKIALSKLMAVTMPELPEPRSRLPQYQHRATLVAVTTPELPESSEQGFPNATLAAASLAQRHKINLNDVAGSGAGGRILKKDISTLIDS